MVGFCLSFLYSSVLGQFFFLVVILEFGDGVLLLLRVGDTVF